MALGAPGRCGRARHRRRSARRGCGEARPRASAAPRTRSARLHAHDALTPRAQAVVRSQWRPGRHSTHGASRPRSRRSGRDPPPSQTRPPAHASNRQRARARTRAHRWRGLGQAQAQPRERRHARARMSVASVGRSAERHARRCRAHLHLRRHVAERARNLRRRREGSASARSAAAGGDNAIALPSVGGGANDAHRRNARHDGRTNAASGSSRLATDGRDAVLSTCATWASTPWSSRRPLRLRRRIGDAEG